MKRILSLFLLLLLALVPVAAVRADGDTCPSSDDGQHNWVVYENPPTCTDTGMREYQCTKCYASRDYETLPALGHDYVERVDKAATCTEAGHAYWVCSRCSDMQEITLPATGHAWDNGAVTQAPTCAAEGVRTFTCTRCGATRTEAIAKTADHTPVSMPAKAATCTEAGLTEGSKCSTCGAVLKAQESIPAKGHSWDGGRVTQEATCTAEGIKTFTCSNCGATRTDTFPAKGHTPAAVPAKAATCTEAGLTEGSQCSACGAVLQAQQSIPAKGHAWDQGVITSEPQGFTPGVKTYTCQNDPSHTYTEPVDPTQSLFFGIGEVVPDFDTTWLRNDPVDGNMLHIVTQPQGGVATADDPLVLTVEATGGEGAYTYNWYREPAFAGMSTSVIADIVTAQGTAIAANIQATQNTAASGLSELNQAWIDQHKIPGVTIAKPSTATEMETMTMNAQPFNPCQEFLGASADPACNGWSGYRYWCVVEDEAGHKATSDKAEVDQGVYITVQPSNINLQVDDASLTVEAAGGSGKYYYDWFIVSESGEDGQMNSSLDRNQSTTNVPGLGKYYVVVTNQENEADHVTSEIVTVYSALPFEVLSCTEPAKLRKDESVEFAAAFTGGVAPYTATWYFNNNSPVSTEFKDGFYVTTAVSEGGYVEFTCRAEDAMGNIATCSTNYDYRQLTILKQPVGGTLTHDGGSVTIDVAWTDGVAPYQVYLYRNGTLLSSNESFANEYYSYTATEPGFYDYYIIDAEENFAYTQFAEVTDYDKVHITEYENAYISSPGGGGQMTVKVEGGQAPYTYEWNLTNHGKYIPTLFAEASSNGTNTLTVYEPGAVYSVTVTDADGDTAYMDGLTVYYNGTVPWILSQPESSNLPYRGKKGAEYSMSLTCAAISGRGDANLEYWWYVKSDSGNDILLTKLGGYNGYSVFSRTGPATLVSGQYKCMVVDPATGGMTVSKPAIVQVRLDNANLTRVDSTHLELDIEGGVGPYTVTVYSRQYAAKVDMLTMTEHGEYANISYDEFLVYEGGLPLQFKVRSTYTSHSMVNSIKPKSYSQPAEYFVVVTDSMGQTVESYIVRMSDDR